MTLSGGQYIRGPPGDFDNAMEVALDADNEPPQALGRPPMKIRLLRAAAIVKEIEFPATLSPVEIQQLSVDLMFEHFERNETHLWPREEDSRGARHEIQVISDEGRVLRVMDIREITKEAGLKFIGRKVDVAGR
jgi:hypothetical protein